MRYKSLSDFLKFLETRSALSRIKYPVRPILEITEIANRVVKRGGPALLFENVEGSKFPLAINLFGAKERMAWALGVEDIEEIAERVEELLNIQPPTGFVEKLKMLPVLNEISNFSPQRVGSGECQEVVHTDPDLSLLPIMKCWPLDGGRYISMGATFTNDPETGTRNAGVYRVQVLGKNTCAMHWQVHKGGARHYRLAKTRGEKLGCAIVLGGDPSVIFSASAPLPDPFDEMLFAGFLRKSPVETVKCKTVNVEVPACADFVIEGYIDPKEPLVKEGPFGDHRGFYSLPDDYPVFHITCITHKKDAVYPSTIVGEPPMEDAYIGYASLRIFLPVIRKILPEIVDIALPYEGAFHNLSIVSIKKQYPGQAKKVMHALWGLGQMMFQKCIIVVDEDVNVRDYREVVWRAASSFDPKRDLTLVEGPVDALDHASILPDYGGKMGLDCTTKSPSEGFTRDWPPLIKMDEAVKKKIDEIWESLGIK